MTRAEAMARDRALLAEIAESQRRAHEQLCGPERCECGKPGKHPYPIGGGWALACDACRAASEQDAATEMPGEGIPAETWDRWLAEAFGR